jgi:polyhydroxybutyrate depolymerase
MKTKTIQSAFPVLIMTILLLAACGALPAVPPTTTATVPAPTPVPTATTAPLPLPPLDEQRALTVGALERGYFLHIPPGLNMREAFPLLFVFHGNQQTGRQARNYTGLDALADANGFVVAYADGSGPQGRFSWNGGRCCGYALEQDVDEPAFVRAMLADIDTRVNVDPKRVYAAGFSNGALLAYRLACEMSDTFAAIAPVAGALTYTPCEPQQPVSLVHVHGLADTTVPFEGGGSFVAFPPVRDSLTTWAALDGCTGAEQVQQDGIVTHTTFGSCPPGVSVELYTLAGVGHTWPLQAASPLTQVVWDFLAAHPKP